MVSLNLHTSPRIRWLFEVIGFALLYYAIARFSLIFAFEHTNVSPIWPPSAVALTLLVRRGLRLSPAVFIGAFLANTVVFAQNTVASLPIILVMSALIAVGNTLEAILGASGMQRYIKTINPFEKTNDFIKFLAIVPVACLASSLIGSSVLVFFGIADQSLFSSLWVTWWLGDVGGILAFAPTLLFTYQISQFKKTDIWRYVEASIFFVAFVLLSVIVFGQYIYLFQFPYILIPAIVWAGFRFGQLGIGATILLVLGVAVWHTVNGLGPFAIDNRNDSLLMCQFFVGVITATGLTLSTALTEKVSVTEELRVSENRYRRLVESTNIIAWEADASTGRFTYVAPQAERLLGYPINRWYEPTFWQDHIHPDDRQWAVQFWIDGKKKFANIKYKTPNP